MRLKCAFIFFLFPLAVYSQNLYRCNDGYIRFNSDAALEVINASSNKLNGILDTTEKAFAFVIKISTFEGFNAALQREHFNENYMESHKYPNATFKGKIIEDINFSSDGEYNIRAKGVLKIHGVEQERIIRGMITIKEGSIVIETKFKTLLKDHNIKVPKVVHEKIASEIEVTVKAQWKNKN